MGASKLKRGTIELAKMTQGRIIVLEMISVSFTEWISQMLKQCLRQYLYLERRNERPLVCGRGNDARLQPCPALLMRELSGSTDRGATAFVWYGKTIPTSPFCVV